jgi:hypothetical protein
MQTVETLSPEVSIPNEKKIGMQIRNKMMRLRCSIAVCTVD